MTNGYIYRVKTSLAKSDNIFSENNGDADQLESLRSQLICICIVFPSANNGEHSGSVVECST